jgi:lipid-A-disaccharide synthase
MKHIFFSVGEPSGDMHAAAVIRRLNGFRVSGIAGDNMAAAGVAPLFHVRETAVMGFTEVAKSYFRLRRLFRKTCDTVAKDRPDLIVLVDYPGFNLALAKFAKTLGIPVLYYIAPKVWAWGKGRVKTMKRVIDRMAVIFPFEERYFRDRGIRADFVGNPSAEFRPPETGRAEFLKPLDIPTGSKVLGLLPGSRRQEVARLLPAMLGAAKILLDGGVFDHALVSRMDILPPGLFSAVEKDRRMRTVSRGAGPLMAHSDFLFVKSGTATLEAALLLKPFLVAYKVSPLSAFIIRRILHLPAVSMVNILLGRAVAPELLQENATPEKLAAEARSLLNDPARLREMTGTFKHLKEDLSRKEASLATAAIIEEMTHG